MHFILDYRANIIAEKLSEFGTITFFNAENTVYPAISGHPDIFISNIHGKYILAPNTPENTRIIFEQLQLPHITGSKSVGFRYPDTAGYNVYADDELAFVSRHTDASVLQEITSEEIISIKQGYIACNLARIGREFITSDPGIAKELYQRKRVVHFVNPKEIKLSGVPNGFIGGAFGQTLEQVFFSGSARSSYASLLSELCKRAGKQIVFLSPNETIDVGGIFIL